ncbi:hypothetical protein L2Y96_20525 [Luteibacter aegosomaticola]|uniref:hypothetical protein n=1 Tax=Luteibacter aegosomaticola TaxID=2911538 RepID=UPI001FFB71B0|nr:hypothetical protein [Luteibacter aegosomaticola]UPG89747.1 hypothetical protein L2Y96_20525 [Luteibacter aegosomaticola]
MSKLEPPIHCKMFRLEALDGPTDFEAQFLCEAGKTSDHFGLRGSDFQIGRDLYTVVPLESDHDVSHLLSLKAASGYIVGDEVFLRSFASALIDMLRRGKTLYDQQTFVVLSPGKAEALGLSTQAEELTAPAPFESYLVLGHRFSKSDYPRPDHTT